MNVWAVTPVQYTHAARITPTDEDVGRYRRRVSRDYTRAIVSLVLATGFAVLVRRGSGDAARILV